MGLKGWIILIFLMIFLNLDLFLLLIWIYLSILAIEGAHFDRVAKYSGISLQTSTQNLFWEWKLCMKEMLIIFHSIYRNSLNGLAPYAGLCAQLKLGGILEAHFTLFRLENIIKWDLKIYHFTINFSINLT